MCFLIDSVDICISCRFSAPPTQRQCAPVLVPWISIAWLLVMRHNVCYIVKIKAWAQHSGSTHPEVSLEGLRSPGLAFVARRHHFCLDFCLAARLIKRSPQLWSTEDFHGNLLHIICNLVNRIFSNHHRFLWKLIKNIESTGPPSQLVPWINWSPATLGETPPLPTGLSRVGSALAGLGPGPKDPPAPLACQAHNYALPDRISADLTWLVTGYFAFNKRQPNRIWNKFSHDTDIDIQAIGIWGNMLCSRMCRMRGVGEWALVKVITPEQRTGPTLALPRAPPSHFSPTTQTHNFLLTPDLLLSSASSIVLLPPHQCFNKTRPQKLNRKLGHHPLFGKTF